MKILDNLSLELIFFIVFGAAIFVSGTTKLRERRRFKKRGNIWDGTVVRSKHISQKNNEGYLIQNYYDLRVEYKEAGHKKQADIKSIREFAEGDEITIVKSGDPTGSMRLFEQTGQASYTPWFLIGMGLLTAVLPVVNNEYGSTYGSGVLAAILLLLGLYLLLNYIREKSRKTIPLDAEIKDILYWKKGKEKSKLTKPSVSYYPIIQYIWNGEPRQMRSRHNYNSAASCQVGSKRMLFYDEEHKCLVEGTAKKAMLFWGIVFLAIAATGLINMIYLLAA